MSIFTNIKPWLDEASAEIQRIEAKAEIDLTEAEAFVKLNAPMLAQAVDGFLITAQTIAGDIDPAAGEAVTGLQTFFDGLVRLVEGAPGPATTGPGVVLPPESLVKTEGN